jgi:zinc/manganese transport system permease protein
MFSGLMLNAWESASIVAVVAGVVGFFIVLRGSAFAAHALPNGAFAGAAGASLIGVDAIVGLAVFSILGALTIAALGRRARHDVATALVIVLMLGLGSLFLSMTTEYAPVIFSLLFGEVLGVSSSELIPIAVIGVICIAAMFLVYRPLMLSSVMPDVAEARGVGSGRMEVIFLLVVALTTTMAVPVVGALLIFSLLISPAAAARSFTNKPLTAISLSVLIALGTVWSAIALAYLSNLPIGFFVGSIGAGTYAAGRVWASSRRNRHSSPGVGSTGRRTAGAESG